MITTYQFARKELQGQQQIRQTPTDKKYICGLKDALNSINKTYHGTSQ